MWNASPWGFSEKTIQPARHEYHACCLIRAGFLAFQPVVDNTRGTHVEQVVPSFQKILRGSLITWYIATKLYQRKKFQTKSLQHVIFIFKINDTLFKIKKENLPCWKQQVFKKIKQQYLEIVFDLKKLWNGVLWSRISDFFRGFVCVRRLTFLRDKKPETRTHDKETSHRRQPKCILLLITQLSTTWAAFRTLGSSFQIS